MDLSVIIPAFNEEAKIGYDVSVAGEFIVDSGMTGEVIVVDDGSTDETYEVAAGALVPRGIKRKVLKMGKNWGKGLAVKTGILAASGDVVIYADSGSCIPYANALPSIWRIREGGLDLACASRKLKESVICRRQPLRRRVLSRLFHWAAVAVGGLPRSITDSQCGFKVCRGDVARTLFIGLETYGFLFELETIGKAVKWSYRVEEFPVEWSCDVDSRLRPGRQAIGIMKELLRVRSIIKKS